MAYPPWCVRRDTNSLLSQSQLHNQHLTKHCGYSKSTTGGHQIQANRSFFWGLNRNDYPWFLRIALIQSVLRDAKQLLSKREYLRIDLARERLHTMAQFGACGRIKNRTRSGWSDSIRVSSFYLYCAVCQCPENTSCSYLRN